MYSPAIVKRRIAIAEEVLGSRLEYHTVEVVERANAALDSLYDEDDKGNFRLTRKMTKREIDWIRNERALMACDFLYWATRYAHIKDKANQIIRYKPNIAQKIMLDVWGELEDLGIAIIILILKARQLGMSTWCELAVAHRAQTQYGVNCVIGSNDPDKSWEMFQMESLCWDMMPRWAMPETTKFLDGKLIEFGNQNSRLSIQHGTQKSGIARGTTPTVAHLSELADYDDPGELVDASLMRAIHDSPNVLVLLESTAKGRHNWWHETWEESKMGWPRRESRFCPVFLPWYVGTDIYPTVTWLRAHPIPNHWKPAKLTENHALRAKTYVTANPLLKKHLAGGKEWSMPLEQQWFWEITRNQYSNKGQLSRFYSELCADDLECFSSTNTSVFSSELISEYREAAAKEPVEVFALAGPGIPEQFHPEDRDIDKKRVGFKVTFTSDKGTKEFHFVPIKYKGNIGYDPNGKLFIWEHPKDEATYGIGVDTSDGIGLDGSAIEVIRNGTQFDNDAQVAEFVSPYINAEDLAPIALAIAAYYRNRRDGEPQTPKVVIECMRNGELCQHLMRNMGWVNFHRWVRLDSKKINRARAHKLGVVMNCWYRPMVVDHLVSFIRNGLLDINSPWFIKEMEDFERDEDAQNMKAVHGGHDDRVMSLGMVMFSLHESEQRFGKRVAQIREVNRRAENEYAVYRPQAGFDNDLEPVEG